MEWRKLDWPRVDVEVMVSLSCKGRKCQLWHCSCHYELPVCVWMCMDVEGDQGTIVMVCDDGVEDELSRMRGWCCGLCLGGRPAGYEVRLLTGTTVSWMTMSL